MNVFSEPPRFLVGEEARQIHYMMATNEPVIGSGNNDFLSYMTLSFVIRRVSFVLKRLLFFFFLHLQNCIWVGWA